MGAVGVRQGAVLERSVVAVDGLSDLTELGADGGQLGVVPVGVAGVVVADLTEGAVDQLGVLVDRQQGVKQLGFQLVSGFSVGQVSVP